ncbi:hypothetical protein H7J87_22480 [Mycolicibacterium wolinskyi]|uniref:Uncharacterized protein n=1 Tax=Mycolicibacterium wolinskyi TaxID=59750 RepID=A0A1X2FIS7_9MYCO|nr:MULTISPECIES: EspA/EspE family type VII secretion system effector [Mycolicibacterium]MCV7288092.1 hypothetical protein [Mycolicibacterium wolinskyi]MCV7296817.1 hypothetical protein [Mycolicibacterium goodii]ORX18345.1 hypothetical protein AWC31_13575 [Mycolicibacterium wolinskyi]
MGALDGFYTTLSRARATFGEGVPATGEEFDGSARLREMEAAVKAAAPDDRWQGSAADAYAAKNEKHAATYGRLADLDKRMGAEVTNSAAVVAAGRHSLDSLSNWVSDMDTSIPRDQSGDRMRLILAAKGIGQINDVIQQSTDDMDAIARRIEDIRKQYDEIAGKEEGAQALDHPLGNPPPVDPLEEIKRKYQVDEDPDGALDWEPGWPWNHLTSPKHVTATEARILDSLAPWELQDLNQTKEAAEVESKVRFPPQNGANDTADNHTDAFRHAYWNALMTQRFGEQWTRDFAEAHERLPGNPATAEAMDLYNNEVGRNIAMANPDATPAELADLVEQAVNRGDTVVVAPNSDGEKLAWSNTVPEGEAGTTSKSTVPGQAPNPAGAGPGGVYDPGQPGGYGTSAGGY